MARRPRRWRRSGRSCCSTTARSGASRRRASAIELRRVKDRHIAVEKASAIIDALHAALDHERGGEIAAQLDQIYTYVGFRLQRINLNGDVAICDELVARLGELRASWAQIADSPPPVEAAPASPGRAWRLPATAVTI